MKTKPPEPTEAEVLTRYKAKHSIHPDDPTTFFGHYYAGWKDRAALTTQAPAEPLKTKDVLAAIYAVDREAARRGEMFPQTSDEQREDRRAVTRVMGMIEWYERNTGCARIKDWPAALASPAGPACQFMPSGAFVCRKPRGEACFQPRDCDALAAPTPVEHGKISIGTFKEHEGWNNEGKPSRTAPPAVLVEPAGFKLVPIEPTEAMLRSIPNYSRNSPVGIAVWRSMLAAAPAVPLEQSKGSK